MKVSIGLWGFEVRISALIVRLFIGDIYVKVPRLVELAWNPAGFFFEKDRTVEV